MTLHGVLVTRVWYVIMRRARDECQRESTKSVFTSRHASENNVNPFAEGAVEVCIQHGM